MPTLTSRAPLNFVPGSRVRGSITLEGIITPDGRVTNVRILDTPDPALNPKAIEAFRQLPVYSCQAEWAGDLRDLP
jgi:hypothetical protein